ncbi:hypothetical protein [Tepidibacillus fermentans]|nr:hypothetical protein [Tepidibacillus fermentans]
MMLLKDIEVVVNTNSIFMNTSRNVIGEIYFKIGDFYFPAEGWDDFVVVILGWWQKDIMNIRNDRIGTVYELDFMDGPWFVKGNKISEHTIELEFVRDKSDSQQIIFTCLCQVAQLQQSILHATEKLLTELKSRKWHSDDIEELDRIWRLLKSLN